MAGWTGFASRLLVVSSLAVLTGCGDRLFDNPFDPEQGEVVFEIMSTIYTPALRPRGMAWDGTVLWNVDPRDWDTAVSDQQVINTILTESDHGEIVLCHDIHERTIGVMPAVLDGLLAQGFSFVTVTELLELQGN